MHTNIDTCTCRGRRKLVGQAVTKADQDAKPPVLHTLDEILKTFNDLDENGDNTMDMKVRLCMHCVCMYVCVMATSLWT